MNKKNNPNNLINYVVLAMIFTAFVAIAYQTGLLTSGFRFFIDDHQIFLMDRDLRNQGWFSTVYQWILYDRQDVFRFRPYYQFHIVTLTQFFGLNAVFWFIYITVIGSLTCFFLFLFGRVLNFSIPISLLFAISILLGNQSEIWIRPLIPDSLGMFFLSMILILLGKSCRDSSPRRIDQIIFIILVIFMSLSKESYILFIPTIIALKIYLTAYFQQKSFQKIIQQYQKTLTLLMAIFILEMVYVLFFLGTNATGYAGVDEKSFQILSLATTAWQLLNAGLIGITLLAIVSYWITNYCFKKQSFNVFLDQLKPYGVFLLIALIPKTFLYAKSGIVAAFYLFPFIVIACLLLAKTLSLIETSYRPLAIVIITFLSILLLSRLPLVWAMYGTFAKDSRLMNQLLTQTEICVNKEQPILIVANPKVRFEAVDSLQRVLRTQGHQRLILATYGLKDADFYSNKLADTEVYWSFLDTNLLLKGYNHQTLQNFSDKMSIQAIIIFDGLEEDFKKTQKSWFSPDNYQSQSFDISFAHSTLYCKKHMGSDRAK